MATLDKMLARSCNQAALQKALERNFRADPVKFFRTVIMPLMPREAKVSMDQEGVIQWRSLLGSAGPERVESGGLTVEGKEIGTKEIGAAERASHIGGEEPTPCPSGGGELSAGVAEGMRVSSGDE